MDSTLVKPRNRNRREAGAGRGVAADWEEDSSENKDCQWTSEGAEITTRRERTLVEELTFGGKMG